jgi:cell division septation protein DedD
MAEAGIREIQLSGKQLAFLFMASVVALVVAFLLGVSVGRGAKPATAAPPPPDMTATTETPISPPPGTSAASDSLSFPKTLQGSAAAAAKPADGNVQIPATSTPPVVAPPPSTTPPPASAADSKTPASPPKPPAASPTAAATSATTTTKSPAPQTGGWYVQVESFRSKANADALVAKLKGMGFDASVTDAPKPLLHVRVGPYAQHAAADAAVTQLKKDGYSSPFVSR